MKVAEMLSDLTSLQVCVSSPVLWPRNDTYKLYQDPSAALALVSARPDGSSTQETDQKASAEESDPDLKRAKDLLELHATVKLAHQDGTDKDLNDAREAVKKVLREL
jgi:hypothetical protein